MSQVSQTLHELRSQVLFLNGLDFTRFLFIENPDFFTTFTFNPAFSNIFLHSFASSFSGVASTKRTASDPYVLNQLVRFVSFSILLWTLFQGLLRYNGRTPDSSSCNIFSYLSRAILYINWYVDFWCMAYFFEIGFKKCECNICDFLSPFISTSSSHCSVSRIGIRPLSFAEGKSMVNWI